MKESESSSHSERLAREVLTLSRNTLLVNLRFLDAALSMFEPDDRVEVQSFSFKK